MNRRILMPAVLLLALACGHPLTQRQIDAKSVELVDKTLPRFTSELEALRQQGLPAGERIIVHFMYRALNKRRAVELQQVIHRLTPYKASIGWFKEPEQGWFVFGEIPAAVPTTQGNTELLTKMVRLGLEHGCEIRWWTPKRPGNPGAV